MNKIFLKFVSYILIKWICFYLYELIKNGIKWNQKINKEGYILAAIMLFTLPLLEIIILIFPFHFALKQKGWITVLILILTFGLEFLMSWYATNQQIRVWMIVKIIISITLFYYLYRKQLTLN